MTAAKKIFLALLIVSLIWVCLVQALMLWALFLNQALHISFPVTVIIGAVFMILGAVFCFIGKKLKWLGFVLALIGSIAIIVIGFKLKARSSGLTEFPLVRNHLSTLLVPFFSVLYNIKEK